MMAYAFMQLQYIKNIDGLVQDWNISIANALEIPQFCIN